MLILQSLLNQVILKNASDLHIGTGMSPTIRVDGRLTTISDAMPMTEAEMEQVLCEVLSKPQYDQFLISHELDFAFSHVTSTGIEVRFRGNCLKEMRGMSAVFRLIPMKIRTLQELGLPDILQTIATKHRGLFLVTGPTGHGKSTTLASIVHEINRTRYEHIVTIEDPIEYVHKPLNCIIRQREIGSDTNSFQEALKHVLRQDPDVILLGELRDLETISAAITAAETGHLVLGTLHTQDAPQSIDRLIGVFPPHQQSQIRTQLASVLLGICSQQLIPKHNGGRACATEILISTPAVKNCIREGKTNQIRTTIQTSIEAGMHTMEQTLVDYVISGVLSKEIAQTYAYDVKDFQRLVDS